MNLKELHLHQFRCFSELALEFDLGFSVFVGPNGAGKTNILEAVYFANALRSFRTSDTQAMIAHGQEFCRISLTAQGSNDPLPTSLKVALAIEGNSTRKRLWIDDKSAKSSLAFVGRLPLIIFTPEDLSLVRGTPALRRAFLDRAVFAHEPAHARDTQAYEKALRSRNHVLKQPPEALSHAQRSHLLDSYDEALSEYGTRIVQRRRLLLARLSPHLHDYFAQIHDTTATQPLFRLHYVSKLLATPEPQPLDQAAFHAQLQGARRNDLIRRTTSLGPHLDDLRFEYSGQMAADHASQGQIRAMILALKLAEVKVLHENSTHPPLLLLDDVTSELDPRRSRQFFAALPALIEQCLITTTGEHFVPLPPSLRAVYFDVESGQISPRKHAT